MDFIIPDWIDAPPNVMALSTLRSGGVSPTPYDDGSGGGGLNLGTHVGDESHFVKENRARLRLLLPAEPAWLTQIHSGNVVPAANAIDALEADASFASQPNVVCVVQTADCLPVLFCDVAGNTVAAAHAGWRGLVNGILENTINKMQEAGAKELLAWLGPAIGPESFEVGNDVLAAFLEKDANTASFFKPIAARPGKFNADIYGLAHSILFKAGVDRVYGGGLCTVADQRRFFSYRRDKVTGRMASLIWLK